MRIIKHMTKFVLTGLITLIGMVIWIYFNSIYLNSYEKSSFVVMLSFFIMISLAYLVVLKIDRNIDGW